MSKTKFDGVVEAVHYAPNGRIDWVRLYERRGPAFSDRLLLSRSDLVQRLRKGQHLVVGQRIILQAGTFQTGVPLRLRRQGSQDWVVVDKNTSGRDDLGSLPIL